LDNILNEQLKIIKMARKVSLNKLFSLSEKIGNLEEKLDTEYGELKRVRETVSPILAIDDSCISALSALKSKEDDIKGIRGQYKAKIEEFQDYVAQVEIKINVYCRDGNDGLSIDILIDKEHTTGKTRENIDLYKLTLLVIQYAELKKANNIASSITAGTFSNGINSPELEFKSVPVVRNRLQLKYLGEGVCIIGPSKNHNPVTIGITPDAYKHSIKYFGDLAKSTNLVFNFIYERSW
jgi:hypothetical protein